MISPWGWAIKPRMPTSCPTWDMFPLAPELAIIQGRVKRVVLVKLRRHRPPPGARSFPLQVSIHLGCGRSLRWISPSR